MESDPIPSLPCSTPLSPGLSPRGRGNLLQAIVGQGSASIPDADASTNSLDPRSRQLVHVDRVVVLPSAAADLHRPQGRFGRARGRGVRRRPARQRRHPLSRRLGRGSVWDAAGDGRGHGGLRVTIPRLSRAASAGRLHRAALSARRRGRRILAGSQRLDRRGHASQSARSRLRHDAVDQHGRHPVGPGGWRFRRPIQPECRVHHLGGCVRARDGGACDAAKCPRRGAHRGAGRADDDRAGASRSCCWARERRT
jgi:hypothetical protein